MAKLTRKKRKQQKQKQQNKLIAQGFKAQDVASLSNSDLDTLARVKITPSLAAAGTGQAVKQVKRKEANRLAAQRYRDKKKAERLDKLEVVADKLGLAAGEFKGPTAKWLDKHSLEELQRLKRTDLKEWIPKDKIKPIDSFDFDKVYKIPNGQKLHFAFRALTGEKDIADELQTFSRYSNEELLSYMQAIAEMPLTGTTQRAGKVGKRVGSSGQAGEGIVRLNSQAALSEAYNKQYNDDRRSNNFAKLLAKTARKKGVGFQHSGEDYHWQHVKQVDDNGRLKAYTEISARKLLIIGNAILWNITESSRRGFYDNFKITACEIIPALKDILP